MAAHRFWRLVGFSVRGAGSLELSEARLYAAGSAVDASVAVICPIAPLSGHLSYLTDGLTTQVVSWPLSAYSSPGFSLTWDLTGSGSSVDAIRFGSGDSSETYPLGVTLQYSDDSAVWTTLRVTTGAAYPGARTLTVEPTALTDLDFEKVSLLLHCDGAHGSTVFADSSLDEKLVISLGDAKVSTTSPKAGSGCLTLDGSSALSIPSSAAFNFDGDYTLEMHARLGSVTGDHHLLSKYSTSPTCAFAIYQSATTIGFYSSSDGTSWNLLSGLTFGTGLVTGVWYHLAITRSGNVYRTFRDGVQIATATVSGTPIFTGQPVYIGRGNNISPSYFVGDLDDVRLTKGVARYTSNFTPPTLAFSDDQLPPVDIGRPARLRSAPLSLEHFVGSDMPDGAAISHLREVSFFDAYNGGIGTITGTVKEKNTPANTPLRRRVLLIDEASRITIRETWSDPVTGAFEFRGIKQGVKYSVISYHGLRNGEIATELVAEPMVMP